MTAEEAALIMMSGGSLYRDEPITITNNGKYIPKSDVRFSEVTVDVPQYTGSGGLIDDIKALPAFYGEGLPDGYAVEFAVDIQNTIPITNSSLYHKPKQGVGNYTPVTLVSDEEVSYAWSRTWKTFQCIRVYEKGSFVFALARLNTSGGIINHYNIGQFALYNNPGTTISELKLGWTEEHKLKQGSIHYASTLNVGVNYDSNKTVNSFTISAVFTYVEEAKRRLSRSVFPRSYDDLGVTEWETDETFSIMGMVGLNAGDNGFTTFTDLKGEDFMRAESGFFTALCKYKNIPVSDAWDYKSYRLEDSIG